MDDILIPSMIKLEISYSQQNTKSDGLSCHITQLESSLWRTTIQYSSNVHWKVISASSLFVTWHKVLLENFQPET